MLKQVRYIVHVVGMHTCHTTTIMVHAMRASACDWPMLYACACLLVIGQWLCVLACDWLTAMVHVQAAAL